MQIICQLPDAGSTSQASSVCRKATALPQLDQVLSVSAEVTTHVRSSGTMVPGLVRAASEKVASSGKAAAGSMAALLRDTVGHGYWRELEPEQHEELRTA
jgi:hypothetical protein